MSGSSMVTATAVNLSGNTVYYVSGSFILTAANLAAGGSVMGTLWRDADDAVNDDYGYDFRILSVTGYYSKKNN